MFNRQVQILKAVRRLTSVKANSTVANVNNKKMDIRCGVCLERKPIISRLPTELELRVTEFLRTTEDEKSMKSDHEVRSEMEARLALKSKNDSTESEDSNTIIAETRSEFEDVSRKERESFIPAPRITEADKQKDFKSLNRELDRHLVYLAFQKFSENPKWLLPEDNIKEGESLRQAAERILKEKYGRRVKCKFYGNAPSSCYKYYYPKPIKDKLGSDGKYVFIMKAQYLGGDVEQREQILDYCWATRSQLEEKCNFRYYKAVNDCLIDEEH